LTRITHVNPLQLSFGYIFPQLNPILHLLLGLGDQSMFGRPTVLLDPNGSISDVFGVVLQAATGEVDFEIV
jgi:hypothetical protein